MKQHITKSQWDELSNKDSITLENFLYKDKDAQMGRNIFGNDFIQWNIGQMIEFLGEDLDHINNMTNGWYVVQEPMIYENHGEGGYRMESQELCDALWEAVKYKLKN